MTALVRVGAVTEAYASWSRWVARCGHCPRGAKELGSSALRMARFTCTTCGAVTEVIWPTVEMVKGVERLLMMRPDPTTRSWKPGETLSELSWENGEHGIYDGLAEAIGAAPGTAMLSVTDNRIQVDVLPKVLPNRHRLELEG